MCQGLRRPQSPQNRVENESYPKFNLPPLWGRREYGVAHRFSSATDQVIEGESAVSPRRPRGTPRSDTSYVPESMQGASRLSRRRPTAMSPIYQGGDDNKQSVKEHYVVRHPGPEPTAQAHCYCPETLEDVQETNGGYEKVVQDSSVQAPTHPGRRGSPRKLSR